MALNQEQFERLEAYIDGELNPAERAEVEQQLVANPQLRKLMAELVATRDLLRGLPRAKAPGDLIETFQGQIERAELLGETGPSESEVVARISRAPQIMAAAAIVLLALGLAGIIYKLMLPHGTTSSPYAIGRNPDELGAPEPEAVGPASRPTTSALAGGGPGREAARSLMDAASGIAPVTGERRDSAATRPGDGLAMELERSRVLPEDLRRARSDVDAAAAAPAGEPIVMLVRSENPQQARAQVQEYLNANKIPFETAPATGEAAPVADAAKSEGQSNLAARGVEATQLPVARSRAAAGGEAERPQVEAVGQAVDNSNRVAAATPAAPKDAANNDVNLQQQAPGQQMPQQSRTFSRNAANQAAAPEPAPSSPPPPPQQQVAQTPPAGGQQATSDAPALASVLNSNGIGGGGGGGGGGKVYRAVLTQRQLRDLNTRLQSQGTQWTEFRGAVSSDAVEANPITNAPTGPSFRKAADGSAAPLAEKLRNESVRAATQPASGIATTLPTITAPAAPSFGNRGGDAKGFSMEPATTGPSTRPLGTGVDRETAREVLIVVNDQPIDVGGTVAGGAAGAAPAATQPAAQTRPAAAPAAKPVAPAPTGPDPRP